MFGQKEDIGSLTDLTHWSVWRY